MDTSEIVEIAIREETPPFDLARYLRECAAKGIEVYDVTVDTDPIVSDIVFDRMVETAVWKIRALFKAFAAYYLTDNPEAQATLTRYIEEDVVKETIRCMLQAQLMHVRRREDPEAADLVARATIECPQGRRNKQVARNVRPFPHKSR